MLSAIKFLVVLFLSSAVCIGNSGCWCSALECLKMKNDNGEVKLGFIDVFALCFWPLPPTLIAFASVKSVDVKTGEITTEKRGGEFGVLLNPMYPTPIIKSGLHDFIRANYTEYITEDSDSIRYCMTAKCDEPREVIIQRKYRVLGITIEGEEKEIPETGLEILFAQKGGEHYEPVLKIMPDKTFLPINLPQERQNNETK